MKFRYRLIAAVALAAASSASADENIYLLNFSCLPELRHIAVSRLHTQNIPHDGKWLTADGAATPHLEKALAAHGVYSISMIARGPLRCVVPASMGDRDGGPRRAFSVKVSVAGDWAIVTADDKEVGRIALDEGRGWKHTRSVTVRDDGGGVTLEICTAEDARCVQTYLSKQR